MDKKAVICFENFSFQYFSQAEPTLHDINLTIYEGEKVLIVGPSGSGKSTLGHCINGLIPFSYKGHITGSCKVGDVETQSSTLFALSKLVGTVLQDADGQFIGITAGEDIAFALENDCVPQAEMKAAVQRVADMVDMGALLASSPFELSGGQKQRVSFAGVMVDDAPILLFDEPLANLDPATGKTAIALIDDIQKQLAKTVVIIEHRIEDVLYCEVDRIIAVANGRIVADTTPAELLSTNLLPSMGIREPLYIAALKYAGAAITPPLLPAHINTICLNGLCDKLATWQKRGTTLQDAPEQNEILRVENLCFAYTKKRDILKNISFSIHAGEMVSIVGTNGAGKSTLAKAICGFIEPASGNIYLDGENLAGQTIKERAAKIGFVMQNPNQMISKAMIFDEVAFGLRIRGVPEDETQARVAQVLKICGLAPFKDWPISALSYGQKKRVTIASMLVLNPRLLILDEPTAGQDYRHYSEIMGFLESLNRQGVTILLITHDMHLMLEYTQHAIVIANGEKIGDASAVEILTNEAITARANLKITSLYELAQKACLPEPSAFVQHFINYEREERSK